jgi:ribosomal silencing factor RsfS
MRKANKEAALVTESIVKGLFEKKGEKVALIDLRSIENRICDYFVITDAPSTKQVDSLAWSVEDVVRKETGHISSFIFFSSPTGNFIISSHCMPTAR